MESIVLHFNLCMYNLFSSLSKAEVQRGNKDNAQMPTMVSDQPGPWSESSIRVTSALRMERIPALVLLSAAFQHRGAGG